MSCDIFQRGTLVMCHLPHGHRYTLDGSVLFGCGSRQNAAIVTSASACDAYACFCGVGQSGCFEHSSAR
jgi:hypothetical protein